eukprot:COSAG02_NODE_63996_length_261_cov_1.740741_1_plen_70_part_10
MGADSRAKNSARAHRFMPRRRFMAGMQIPTLNSVPMYMSTFIGYICSTESESEIHWNAPVYPGHCYKFIP